jgi:hypothetical protein
MQRSGPVFVLSVLAALLLAFAAPDSSEARLRVFIGGEELNPEELLPSDGVPRLRGCSEVDGPDCRAVFIVEGTFPAAPATPEFTVDGIDDKRARVVLLDGDSVDQIVLTDARITRLADAASSSLLVRFFNEAGDLAPVPGGLDYAYAVFADGGFNRLASGRRRALNVAIGDTIEVTGRANRAVIDRTLVHVVEGPDTAAFAQDTTALLTCPGEEGSDCVPVLDTTVAITFTQVSDFLILNGSVGALGSNIAGPGGQGPVDGALKGRPPQASPNSADQPGSVLIFPQFSQGVVVTSSVASGGPQILEPGPPSTSASRVPRGRGARMGRKSGFARAGSAPGSRCWKTSSSAAAWTSTCSRRSRARSRSTATASGPSCCRRDILRFPSRRALAPRGI